MVDVHMSMIVMIQIYSVMVRCVMIVRIHVNPVSQSEHVSITQIRRPRHEVDIQDVIDMVLWIRLPEIVLDKRARDGTWCTMPYPNHPKGCPNYPKCIEVRKPFELYNGLGLNWFAVIEEFDLKEHAKKMKEKHPNWTDRQCRNVLYWQNSVRKKLSNSVKRAAFPPETLEVVAMLERPEANGVNVFATMAKRGIFLKANPDIVRKIFFVGAY